MAILSPLAFTMLTKNLLVCLGVIHLQNCAGTVAFPPAGPVPAGRPRVVWIIFDETDYRIAFEQRPGGVQLPAFDRLQAESLFATDAYSPADATLLSMPSLIIGRRVVSADAKNTSDLKLTFADTGADRRLEQAAFGFFRRPRLGCQHCRCGLVPSVRPHVAPRAQLLCLVGAAIV